jgi:hypothetical protein
MRVKPRNYVAKAVQSGAGKHINRRQLCKEYEGKRDVFNAAKTIRKDQLEKEKTIKIDIYE